MMNQDNFQLLIPFKLCILHSGQVAAFLILIPCNLKCVKNILFGYNILKSIICLGFFTNTLTKCPVLRKLKTTLNFAVFVFKRSVYFQRQKQKSIKKFSGLFLVQNFPSVPVDSIIFAESIIFSFVGKNKEKYG